MIRVSSPSIRSNEVIPRRHVRDGDDVSPPLQWQGVPGGTAELALVCEDPDAPRERPFVHWVLFGVPPDLGRLEEGTHEGKAGVNSFGEKGYGGPQPPKGDRAHHYHFRVYAVDQRLDLDEGASADEVRAAMADHVLDEGELVGLYQS